MSRRARRHRRRRHQLACLRHALRRTYERMDAAAGSIMNMEWLDAAAEADQCADRLAQLGRPLSQRAPATWRAPAACAG